MGDKEKPVFNFSFDTSVSDFAVSKRDYLAARPGVPFGYIATSAVVLDASNKSEARVLLIQRAASDSDPHKWEPPGGACDDDDETVLYGAARELWEEAGLQASRILSPVGNPYFFTVDNGSKKVCQFNFAVHVKGGENNPLLVKLDPKEHQSFVWATESEVKARKAGDISLEFTRNEVEQTVLSAFQLRSET